MAKTIYINAMIQEKVLSDAASDWVEWHNIVKAASHFSATGWDGVN